MTEEASQLSAGLQFESHWGPFVGKKNMYLSSPLRVAPRNDPAATLIGGEAPFSHRPIITGFI